MKSVRKAFFCVIAMAAGIGSVQAQSVGRELPDFARLVEEQGSAVVNISTTQAARRTSLPQVPGINEEELQEFFRRFVPRNPGQGAPGAPRPESRSLGSGFFVSNDGYILTNAHVVDGAEEISVRLTDKREFKARLIGSDKRTDVAVLKIDAANLPVVRIGNAERLKVGEWVLAIGSPFGFENTVTQGIVSAKGRSLPQENFVPFIQTDVAINPGNSGGPLFNMRGEVVGINSQIYSRTGGFMGLSFAIPIDVALDVHRQLRDKGRVARGRIGVSIQEVTKDLASSFGLDRPRGALVNSVEKGGPADKAGVEELDIILRFDGKPVEASIDLPRVVGATRPGAQVTAELLRKGSTRTVTISVSELIEDRVAGALAETPRLAKPVESPPNRLGIVVSDLTPEQRRDPKLTHGIVVSELRPDTKVELRRGDILLAVVQAGRHTELRSVEQFNKLLTDLPTNAVLTLHVRRGESNAFVTVNGLADRG